MRPASLKFVYLLAAALPSSAALAQDTSEDAQIAKTLNAMCESGADAGLLATESGKIFARTCGNPRIMQITCSDLRISFSGMEEFEKSFREDIDRAKNHGVDVNILGTPVPLGHAEDLLQKVEKTNIYARRASETVERNPDLYCPPIS